MLRKTGTKTCKSSRWMIVMNDLDAIPYQERLEDLLSILSQRGSLGALLIDLKQISQTEHDYGSSTYESELDVASDLILKLVGTQVRTGDLLTTSETVRDAFLVFLSPQRTQEALRVSGLQAAAGRIEHYLNRSLAELPSFYIPKPLTVTVGSAIVLHNPLVAPNASFRGWWTKPGILFVSSVFSVSFRNVLASWRSSSIERSRHFISPSWTYGRRPCWATRL